MSNATFSDLNQLELSKNKRHWFNIDGIHEPQVIATIGEIFNLHPLILEDIMNTEQKPKFESYEGNQLFLPSKCSIIMLLHEKLKASI
jgi:magnesium transporter